jgi:hypothetical protein
VTLRRPTDRRDNAWITEDPIGGKHLKFRSPVPDRLEAAYDVALGEGLLEQHLLTPEQQMSLYQCCGLPCPIQDKPWPIFPANVDALVIITNKGRAMLAENRSASGVADAESPLDLPIEADNWADYRNSPGGPLLTVEVCQERFGVSGPALSQNEQAKTTRRKNPDGRGYVYRYDVVARMANRQSGDE